jgi:membrane protein implicated in regulation of membrane protease activity
MSAFLQWLIAAVGIVGLLLLIAAGLWVIGYTIALAASRLPLVGRRHVPGRSRRRRIGTL